VAARRVDWLYAGTTGAVALVTMALAVRHLRRAAHPLVELSSLRIPTFRVTAVGGSFFRLAIGAVTIALCGLVTAHTPLVVTAVILFASGVFRSIGFTAYNTISFVDVPAEAIGDANTLTTTIQQLTMGLSVVAGALALRAGGPIARFFGVTAGARTAFAMAFCLIAVIALFAVIEPALLQHDAGAAATAAPTVEQPT